MGVRLGGTNDGRGVFLPRPSSPRVVPGAHFSVAPPKQRDTGKVGVLALADLPSIEQRRRYMAALGRIVHRIRHT